MRQLSRFRYEVTQGETVTITVVPYKAGPSVTVAGIGVNKTSDNPPTFQFTAAGPVGSRHTVAVRGDFLPDDAADASFAVSLCGDTGGACEGDVLDCPGPGSQFNYDQYSYTFTVVA
jgi:hypothetical protein